MISVQPGKTAIDTPVLTALYGKIGFRAQ